MFSRKIPKYQLSLEPNHEESNSVNHQGDNSVPTNKIYFYSDVTRESIFMLNRDIDNLETRIKTIQYNYELPMSPPIKLYIASEGGEVFSAFSAVDRIKSCNIPIYTVVEGVAASCATLLSVVGTHRQMRKNAVMMIHQLRGGLWGKFEDCADEYKNLELIMQMIKSVYLSHTKISDESLTEMLKHDIWMTAGECLKYGMIDEII